jgi:hypothetical protein
MAERCRASCSAHMMKHRHRHAGLHHGLHYGRPCWRSKSSCSDRFSEGSRHNMTSASRQRHVATFSRQPAISRHIRISSQARLWLIMHLRRLVSAALALSQQARGSPTRWHPASSSKPKAMLNNPVQLVSRIEPCRASMLRL